MLARSHVLSGEVAWLATAPHWTGNGWHITLGAAVAGAAALGPDIDHGGSTVSHRLWGIHHYWVGARIGDNLGGHRQGAHSLLSVVVVAAVGSLTVLWPPLGGWWLPAALTIGWAAHIAGDLLTEHGVGLLWPWSYHRYRVASIRTGGGFETFIRICLHAARVWLIVLLAAPILRGLG